MATCASVRIEILNGVHKIDDPSSCLSEVEAVLLKFLIDLEDRGSEWPHSQRISNGASLTISRCEQFLTHLEVRGFVCKHLNLTEMTRYSISQSGRAHYFGQKRSKEK